MLGFGSGCCGASGGFPLEIRSADVYLRFEQLLNGARFPIDSLLSILLDLPAHAEDNSIISPSLLDLPGCFFAIAQHQKSVTSHHVRRLCNGVETESKYFVNGSQQ